MSQRGNDLVRRYLWLAALSAVPCNPAGRALYRRVVAKHPDRKAIAICHARRKRLHLAFAVWQTDQPFDPSHHPWEGSMAADEQSNTEPAEGGDQAREQAAGHQPETVPAEEVVRAACADRVAAGAAVGEGTFIDFGHLKRQLPLERVLSHLGLMQRLPGSGVQRRGAGPIHRGDGRGRTFSVNRADNGCTCFDSCCGKQGDVIDRWAALQQLELRAAALDLVRTCGLEPAPPHRTEKRDG